MSARHPVINEAAAMGYFNSTASVLLSNGTLLLEEGAAYDQAHMRAGQLSSLLMLMRVDDASGFRNISDAQQLSLMWLASQLADELQAVLPLAAKEQCQEVRP